MSNKQLSASTPFAIKNGLPSSVGTNTSGLSRPSATSVLLLAVSALFITQLVTGTAFYFAGAVYLTLVIVILTLQYIGYASIAGVLIGYFAFRYLVLSQVAKLLYGQPGQTNLAAPETTIMVLLVGITMICLASILVAIALKDRQIVSFQTSPETLVFLRNTTFAIGMVALLSTSSFAFSESGDAQYGGIIGIAKQLNAITYFAVMVETWRCLQTSDGRQSTSPYLIAMVGILVAFGFAFNSKTGIVQPVIAYLLASAVFRRSLSRRQVIAAIFGAVVFVGIIYPMVHILRAVSERAGIILELSAVFDLVAQSLTDPNFLRDQWDLVKATPDETVYAQGLYYLGVSDDLLGRFLLIANTDTIVNAVNNDGIYGPSLIMAGIDSSLPHFISPNKMQISTGDVVTWYYGLRSWGYIGYPANGLLADCYAALGWAGVVIIPFFLQLVLLTELQLVGRNVAGNLVGAFLLLMNFHIFGESNIQQYITNILRGMPQYFILIIVLFYLADALRIRRARGLRALPLAR